MEKKVNELIEESAHAGTLGDYQTVSCEGGRGREERKS